MPQRLKVITFVIGVLINFVICWSGAYFLTGFLYRQLQWSVSPYLTQIINSLLGFAFVMLIFSIIGRLPRRHAQSVRAQIFDALRRIAKGDFAVSLELPNQGPFLELAQSINQMAGELGEVERMRQEFITNVSHEVQSPLTSISGFARVLKNDDLSAAERSRYLDIIEAESLRLSQLSDNLMKLTSLESEHPPFEPRPFRLDKQLRNVALAAEPQWRDKRIELEMELEEAEIRADEDLLTQVWANLLTNAIKFTAVGGEIRIGLAVSGNQVAISIQDTGKGISRADQEHVFERFFKADKSRNRGAGGNGLGLSIVKKIVDMHEGQITVKSDIDAGTTMTVCLPLVAEGH